MKNGQRVLVVDDEVFVQEVARTMLTQRGYIVETACNGAEAHACFDARRPDIVICDVIMPDMDGVTFFARTRKAGHKTPFLFLTSVRDGNLAAAAMRAGASGYCYKPMDVDALVQEVERLTVITRGDNQTPPPSLNATQSGGRVSFSGDTYVPEPCGDDQRDPADNPRPGEEDPWG